MQTNNLKQLYNLCLEQLQQSSLDEAKSDLNLIFSHVLGVSKGKLRFLEHVNKKQEKHIKKLVNKRKKHVPVQYLIKNVEFINLKLIVNKSVLIPRNETEQLSDMVIKNVNLALEQNRNIRVLDMCCGSGAIGLSIAKQTKSFVDLADVSGRALKVAKKNAKLNNIQSVNFIKSNLFEKISSKYDFFVSNPPYIKSKDLQALERQVKNFEPMLALDGGESGLEFYKKIILDLPHYLNENAVVFFEVGIGQAEQVAKMLLNTTFKQVEIVKDYYGIERIVKAKF